jgi:hypothetical protein
MTRALSVNNKDTAILVEFQYGDPASPTYTRMTSWSQDLTTFTSTPALEVSLGSNIGTLEDRETTIRIPLVAGAFSDLVSNGEPHSPIFVTITESTTDPTGAGDPDTLTLFKGQVRSVTRNAGGAAGVVALACVPQKNLLRVPLGIPCNNQCEWTLGDPNCKVNMASLSALGLLTAVSVRTATITGLTPPGGDATYYSRGYVKRDGLWIGIRVWSSSTATSFELVKAPPAAWIGQYLTVFPGCQKTIEVCRARFSNELNFGGMGYAMPSWHPAIEGP